MIIWVNNHERLKCRGIKICTYFHGLSLLVSLSIQDRLVIPTEPYGIEKRPHSMRGPHYEQSTRPHAFQHSGENVPLFLAGSSNERGNIHDVEITEVVLGATCVVT